MAKTFALVNTSIQVPSTPTISQDVTNWKQCVICQEETKEPLTCPANSKRKDLGSGYSSLTQHLIQFNELNKLPFPLERLDEGGGIEMAMVTNQAQYHQLCRLKYSNIELQRAEKRASEDKENSAYTGCKHRRLQSNEKNLQKDACFFVVSHQALVVFIELLLSSWIIEYGAVQCYFRIQNC